MKKLTILFFSLWTVTTLTFVLSRLIPGSPFLNEEAVPEEILQSLNRYYGLDQPLWKQYVTYFSNVVHGDLGPSLKYHDRTANDIIREAFPVSLVLGLEVLILSITLGIVLGSMSALKQGKMHDKVSTIASILGISVPSFVLTTVLQYIFSIQLGWFSVGRWGTFQQTILPTISLAALPTAVIARLTRANMVETLQQDYILTARAKGLSTSQVVYRHALRNSLIPVIAYIGPLVANVLTGSFVIEEIFAIPGLGQWFVSSVANRDYSLIMSLTLFYAAFMMTSVFVVDIIYAYLDPRIKVFS